MALNVLIVDDSATLRAVIIKTLRMAELPIQEVYEAPNGEEALKALRDNWVDLVFTDLNMPVMDGLAMVDRMAQDDLMKTTPVIVVSTEGSATRIEELKSKGVRAFVRKPFTPELIRETVERVLEGGTCGLEP
ncbi:MAG: response regulator [FCB group bacterium]|jgi:two-component system chemotaxis response regulator CheY|nr:response regulator [FCB group bacterium]